MPRFTSYALQYANVSFSAVSQSTFDLFITEGAPLARPGSTPALTDNQVASLVGQGRTVAGYVNVAVTDDNRGYWNSGWTTNGSDTGSLTPGAPSWLAGQPLYDFSGDNQPDARIVRFWDRRGTRL
jgi:Predicted extracellular endo alpha-1,4 polygalactosaminidase or related polysaccharide hydrolase